MLEILYQDEICVAVNKPAGMLVHRTFLDHGETVFVMQLLRDRLGCKVYPIHRIDKPTSGVLLFAIDPEQVKPLMQSFETGETRKRYLAVVRGYLEGQGTIDYALKREVDDYTQAATAVEQDAVTHYRMLSGVELPDAVGRYPTARYSLVELRPETGRKHQLRRHMAHLRHPIVGDTRHGDGAHNRYFRDRWQCARMLLHASLLEFQHPISCETISIQAPLPTDFQQVIESIGLYENPYI